MSTKGRKKKNGLAAHHSEKTKAIAVINVGHGVDSIRYGLQSCLESNIRTIYIVDDAYSPNAPIYTEENTAAILKQFEARRTLVYYAPTLDLDEFERRNPSRSKDDILITVPPDCYVVKGVVTKTVEYIEATYKSYDHYSIVPQTNLKFSLWNGLIFALFMFDWFRAMVNRFQIHENTHVKFTVLKRKMGHPEIPQDYWIWGSKRHPYIDGGAGTCLHPTRTGLEYFLYLLYSHSRFGVGAFLLFQLAWTLMVGFPFYNWMPVINYWLSAVDPFGGERIFLWAIHGLIAVLITNKYFNEEALNKGKQLQWVHAVLIPLWISFPIFPILMIYGRFLYRGYRPPPPPPDITPPSLEKPKPSNDGVRPKKKSDKSPPGGATDLSEEDPESGESQNVSEEDEDDATGDPKAEDE